MVIWRTQGTVAAPFKASGTSDILLHACSRPLAAVELMTGPRNHKRTLTLCSGWISISKAGGD